MIKLTILRLTDLRDDETGQALAEYGLLLALIAVACLAGVTALGLAIAGQLGAITGAL